MSIERDYTSSVIDPLVLSGLRPGFSGELLTPEDPAYAAARRLTNRRFDNRPALIARCRTSQGVAQAVRFAREQCLEIAVRSGGHSSAGHSTGDGVLMIDLAAMKQIVVAPDRRSARVQLGVTNGELVLALGAQALATTTGTCATVGMGGSTLGGGIGWLMGRFGATVDNVLACELVTANGEILTASEAEQPDLFWALRGGGGNFGVVTAITYRLHALDQVLGGLALFPLDLAPQVLRMYRELTAEAPDELMTHAVLGHVPEFGPALVFQAVYSGENLSEGERLLAPLRGFGPPPVDLIGPRSYAETYMMLTPPIPPGASWADTAYSLREPSDTALDALVATALERPSPHCVVEIHQFHGAATRVPPGATALALREEHYVVDNIGLWVEGDGAAETAWAWQAKAQMQPHASPGVYVNFLNDEGETAVRDAYRANYERLAAVKRLYDPENLFRRNQNIRPV